MADDYPEGSYDEQKGALSNSLRERLEERLRELEDAEVNDNAEKAKILRGRKLRKKSVLHEISQRLRGRVHVREIASFCEELGLMLAAGMTIVPALRTLAERRHNPSFCRMLRDMADMIESGATFTEAASVYRYQFGKFFISLFHAGERSGTLVNSLQRVAKEGENITHFRYKLTSVLIYPVIVVLVATVVIGFAFSFTMSTFAPLMQTFDVEVPWTMQTLIRIGTAIQSKNFWVTAAGGFLVIFFAYVIANMFSVFRLIRGRILIRLPFIRSYVKQALVVNFSRVFSTMLHAGVPLPEALEATRETTKNEVVRLAIDRTYEAVREGKRVVPPLVREQVFPPLAHDMMMVGEETGSLDTIFSRIADIYEKKFSNDMEILGKILQPAIIVFLAGIVGFIVISLFQTYATLLSDLGLGM